MWDYNLPNSKQYTYHIHVLLLPPHCPLLTEGKMATPVKPKRLSIRTNYSLLTELCRIKAMLSLYRESSDQALSHTLWHFSLDKTVLRNLVASTRVGASVFDSKQRDRFLQR